MKWYSGPIQDAIAAAKHDQKIFLVFVEGKDETSKSMAQKIMEEDISGVVDENCVSVKLITDSEPFRQFSQIYPVIVVPSMFFIGSNGIPLEVIAGSENKEELVQKIQKAIELHKSKMPDPAASTSTTTAAASAASVAPLQKPPTGQASETAPAAVRTPVASTSAQAAISAEPELATNQVPADQTEAEVQASLKQKVERAEQLMAERRKLKEKEEKEEERQREMEQRRAGREMQKAREQMKEKELLDWAKQRQREKQEEKAARDRILAQIAQDKADRAAKFQYSGSSPPPADGEGSSNLASSASSSVRQRSPESASTSVSSQEVKIQFRLPNSTATTHVFPAVTTLNDVVRHVDQVIKPGLSGFTLATSFPRRHFTKAEYSRTLRELELCPSAVLLVLPAYAVSTSHGGSSNGRFWAMLWTILSPVTIVWNFIYSFIFGSGSSQPPGPVQNDVRGSASGPTSPQNNQRSTGQKPGSNRKSTDTASRYRKDGNIHHLSNESSNDDEDGTWNGNSTQQM